MNFPSTSLRLFLRRFVLLLGIYTLLRRGFYIFNLSLFSGAGVGGVLEAFLHGLRFDIAALLWLNAPLLLVALLLPGPGGRSRQLWIRSLFVALNAPGLVVNIADWQYFKFIGRRSSNELLTIGGDIGRQSGQLLGHYWYLLFPLAAGLWALWRSCPMLPVADAPTQKQSRGQRALRFGVEGVLAAALFIVGVRGGLQLKPLQAGMAFEQSPVLGHLVLNSTFTILKTVDQETVKPKRYFATTAALRPWLPPPAIPAGPPQPLPADNVVILLLESFGSEYNGVENGGRGGYTPFFDSLAQTADARLMPHHYANGRRSIEALPAVLAGLPSLMDAPFITSPYQTNELHGLGDMLQRHGYTTAMYHGATNGTMGFNDFSSLVGMQKYYGLSQYPGGKKSPDYDEHWGIFDVPYLQYFEGQLSHMPQPFFALLFTLSAHDPFNLPEAYQGKLPKGTLPIHPTIAYSDAALREFFHTASRQPWFNHTLFILTADHTSQSDNRSYKNPMGDYKTPLLFYRPGRPLPPVKPVLISQQADIPASVLHLLGLRQEAGFLLPFGGSVFDSSRVGRALFRTLESYFLVHADYITSLSTTNDSLHFYPYQLHRLKRPPLSSVPPAIRERYGKELKASVQFFVNGLLENKLYK